MGTREAITPPMAPPISAAIAMTSVIVQSIRPKNKNTTAALTLTASEISCLSALSQMSESSMTTTSTASRITPSAAPK